MKWNLRSRAAFKDTEGSKSPTASKTSRKQHANSGRQFGHHGRHVAASFNDRDKEVSARRAAQGCFTSRCHVCSRVYKEEKSDIEASVITDVPQLDVRIELNELCRTLQINRTGWQMWQN